MPTKTNAEFISPDWFDTTIPKTMKKFTVYVTEVHVLPVEVEASTKDEAREKVATAIAECSVNFDNLEYSHSMPTATWKVEKSK